MAARQSGDLDLLGYLTAIRRRWLIVAIIPLVSGLAAFLQARQQPTMYKAQTTVLVSQSEAEQLFDPVRGNRDPVRVLADQVRIVESQTVRHAAETKLGYRAPINAAAAEDQDVLTLTARETTAKRAADVANAYANAYVDYRVNSAKSDAAVASIEITRQITAITTQIAALDAGAAQKIGDPSRASLVEDLNGLRREQDQLRASANVSRGGVEILQRAVEPTAPYAPKPVRSLALGLIVGALIGLSIAFLVDYLDDSIKDKDDLGAIAPTVPVLALIPKVQGWKDKRESILVSAADPSHPAAEAYRTLRTSIQFQGLDRSLKTIQVTSSKPSEGKSATVANLAVALARAGERVVVVCCDLRHPRIHEFFGLSNSRGFTSVLLGRTGLSGAVQAVPGGGTIRVLAAGPPPPNPSELLTSARADEIFSALEAQADVVLIDSPPVLPVTDSVVLATKVDGVLLVASAGTTNRKEFARSLETLEQVGAPIIGCVLNAVSGAT